MLPEEYLQIGILIVELIVFIFAVYYFLKLRSKVKKLQQQENIVDTNYHQIVDDALSKERKILDDATAKASNIVTGAQYVSQTDKEAINQALSEMVKQIQKESLATSTKYMSDYNASLKQLSQTSLGEFQTIANGLQTDLQQQIKNFRESLLPNLEKDMDEYKKIRIKQTEELVAKIVEKASQEVFNKTISLEDHQKLLTDSLEKAKAEGVFD